MRTLSLFLLTFSLASSLAAPAMAAGKNHESKRAPASSASCNPTSLDITTVLLHASEKLGEIRKAGLAQANSAPTCENVSNGVRNYHFEFSTCGNCMPGRAVMTVNEDKRPSFADGPVKYEFEVTYSK